MRRILLSLALLILVLLTAGCLATVTEGPAPVTLQSVEATPTAAAEDEAAEWPVFKDVNSGLSFPYPPTWTVLTGGEMIDRFATARPEASSETLALPWLALVLSPAEDNANFSVAVLPAEGLPLQLYLDSVTNGLSAMEGAVVHESALRTGLRPGGVAIPSIRYDVPDGISGWQVAFFDDHGAQLFVFTLTAPTDLFDEFVTDFERVVAESVMRNP